MAKAKEIVLVDRNGEECICMAEGFETGHNTFILIRDTGRQPKNQHCRAEVHPRIGSPH